MVVLAVVIAVGINLIKFEAVVVAVAVGINLIKFVAVVAATVMLIISS